MLQQPGLWFIPAGKDDVIASILPPNGTAPRYPSQHPLATMGGYTVASRLDPVTARQLCYFPSMVKLVDVLLDFEQERRELVAATTLDQRYANLVSDQLKILTLVAQRLRDALGTTAELPTLIKVQPNRWESEFPPFSQPHLQRLAEVGLTAQAERWVDWTTNRDPFRGVIL